MSYKAYIPVAILIVLFGIGAYYLTGNNGEQSQESLESMDTEPTEEIQLAEDLNADIEPISETVRVILKTTKGDITLDLEGARAPITVGNFVALARDGFYDGTSFHRVIPNFMIQGGDPFSQDQTQRSVHGTGDPGYKFQDEINAESYGLHEKKLADVVPPEALEGAPEAILEMTIKEFYESQGYQYTTDFQSLPLERGVIAMANGGPNTNGSQFFILVTSEVPHLEGKHTPFGRVVEGMDIVDAIVAVPTDEADNPVEPVVVNSVEVSGA